MRVSEKRRALVTGLASLVLGIALGCAVPIGLGKAGAANSVPHNAVAPGIPTGVIASAGYEEAVVTWSAPSSAGSASITRYVVTSAPGGATCSTTGALTCIVSGLTDGTSYTFTVVAVSSAGSGKSSAPSLPVIPGPSVPTPPTSVKGVAGNGQIVVSWTASASNGGSAISSYVATAAPGGMNCTSSTVATCTITGLTNGSSYTVRVVAANALGSSAASSPSSPITPITVPAAPTSVVATSSPGALVVTWIPPAVTGGSAIRSYTATASPGGASCTYPVSSPEADQCTIQGLTNGSSYTVTLVALNGVGSGVASAPSASAVPVASPGIPVNPTVVIGNAQLTVSWSAPASNGGAAITSYQAVAKPGRFTCSTSTTSCTISGLTNGTHYVVTVSATNSAGPGQAATAAGSSTPAVAPSAPTSVSVVPENDAAEVSWSPPVSIGGSTVLYYTATASPSGANCSSFVFALEGDSCIVTGLTNGTPYTFTVTATNSVGTGSPSAFTSAVTPLTTPGAPLGIVAAPGNGQASVAWNAPTNNGGNSITKYTVVAKPGGASCTATTTTSCVVSGLINGSSYTFRVTATNAAGNGPISGISNAITPSAVPGAPTSVAAERGNGQATVSWIPPAQSGGSQIESFTVTSSPGGLTCSYLVSTPEFDSCTVLGLTNGTSYTFSVTATNVAGTGLASSSTAAVIPMNTPGAPVGVTATPENSSVIVGWIAPSSNGGSAISAYLVTAIPGGETCSSTTATSCSVNGLSNGTAYRFSVVATNAAGTGPASSLSTSVVPVTTPGSPITVTATPGVGQAVISWVPPTSTGGSPILDYTASASPGGATCVYTVSTPESDMCTITGLSNGVSYTFSVLASNVIGSGPVSASSAAVVPLGPPSVPLNVQAVPANAQATVSWSAPNNTGGSPITGYLVAAVQDSSKTCTTTGALTCNVSGLVNGLSYSFVVTAVNSVGSSYSSQSSAEVIPASTTAAPNNVTATPGNAQLVISWTPPLSNGGSAITSYVATASPGGATCTYGVVTPEIDSCTITGLTNGTAYSVSVAAINAIGTGTAGSLAGTATPISLPGPPTKVKAAIGNASSVVTWTPPAQNGGSIITSYLVTASPGGATCTYAVVTPEVDACTVVGLSNGTAYSFAVSAINAAGGGPSSSSSSTVTPATLAAPPAGVIATAGNSQASVSWTAPTNDGGAPVTRYTVTATPGGATCTSSLLTCSITGLTNGTEYYFTVTSTNSIGVGAASIPSNQVTPGTVPVAATGVNAVYGNTQATVSWTPPVATGGFRITKYVVTANPGGATCTDVIATPEVDTCTVTGLTNGTSYTFNVVGTNSQGNSLTSTPSAPIIPATVPNSPTGVFAAPAHSQATVSWTKPTNSGGQPILSYTATATPGGASCTSTSALSCVITGLTDGTSYTFIVTATNLVGTSSASTSSPAMFPGLVINGIDVYPGGSYVGANLSGANLSNYALTNANLTNTNLSNVVMPLASFAGSNLTGAKFSGDVVTGTSFAGATLGGNVWQNTTGTPANFPTNWLEVGGFLIGPGALLVNANLGGLNLAGADLQNANVGGANFSGTNLSSSTFMGASLAGAYFANANLTGANLSGDNLTGVSLAGAGILGANFSSANLTNAELAGVTTESQCNAAATFAGGAHYLGWSGIGCVVTTFQGANLSGADLTGAALAGASFQSATLTNANLTNTTTSTCANGAQIWGNQSNGNYGEAPCVGTSFLNAILTGANLSGAALGGPGEFSGTLVSGGITGTPASLPIGWSLLNGYLVGLGVNLENVNFSNLNLTNAQFQGADLTNANFNGSNLSGADFVGSTLNGATFSNADLTNVQFGSAALANTSFSAATLTGVSSGSTTGTPINLPAGWIFVAGYFVGAGANLQNATITGTDLESAVLANANLTGANLSGDNLTGVSLAGAGILGANFSSANLTNAELAGVTTESQCNAAATFAGGAHYLGWSGIGCVVTTFQGANLSGADLTGAALAGASFQSATLTNANLTNTTTSTCANGAQIWGNQSNGNYGEAPCVGTSFLNAILTGANLSGAALGGPGEFSGTLVSGGITGTPASLPIGWTLQSGYLFGS